jgi:hypothetical protein
MMITIQKLTNHILNISFRDGDYIIVDVINKNYFELWLRHFL